VEQANLAKAHLPIGALDHVIDRQRGAADRGEGFHLYAGAIAGLHPCFDQHPRRVIGELQINLGSSEADGVAEWNQIRRTLGGNDPREARRGEHVPFLHLASPDSLESGGPHAHLPARHGHPQGLSLGADVNHFHAAFSV
jgi:hypothetical protein